MADPGTTFELHGPAAIDRRLADATAARWQRDRLLVQLDDATSAVEEAAALVEERQRRLVDEAEDVRRLDSFSLGRIWSELTGGEKPDRQKEIDELEEARFQVARAREDEAEAVRAMAALRDRVVGLGDVDRAWERAAADKAAWIGSRSDPRAARLAAVAEELGECEAQLVECAEATAAGQEALGRLAEVAHVLDVARGVEWDDVFADRSGATAEQRKRLDRMGTLLRITHASLQTFSREVADISDVVASVKFDGWERSLEGFFDDVYSNLSIHSRIGDAVGRVDLARERVNTCLEAVDRREQTLSAGVDRLAAERAAILSEPLV